MLGSEGTGSLVPPQHSYTMSVLENESKNVAEKNKNKQNKTTKYQRFPQMSVPQPQLNKPVCLLLASCLV